MQAGERFFGYFPMATEVLLTPRAAPFGVVDAAEHRASLMPAYNAYRHPDPDDEDAQILLRPLFLLAFLLAARGCAVSGLTSSRNEQFVRGLGVYDDVATYDRIEVLPRRPVAFIDLAGDERVRRSVNEHFRDDLGYSGFVGMTHLDPNAFTAATSLDHGPPPEPVSANALLRERVRATGQERLDADVARAWERYVAWSRGWLTVRRAHGPEAVRAAFLDVLGGGVAPNEAYVVSMLELRG